ncbi:MAG: hypothetical protein LUF02_03835 [Erysipelotrichaceae bacterium]|nr:hypothetical protein [Erysipelotrichaceae bacterium]
MKDKKLSIIYKICSMIYIVFLIYAFYRNWMRKYFFMTIVSCFTPFIAPMIMRILKVQVPIEFNLINIVFVFMASLWGSCLGGYTLAYFDKIVHFLCGIIFTELFYMLYKYYLRDDKQKSLMFIFVNGLNMAAAVIWEFYEYFLFYFFQYDAIRNSTGVYDTITDMIVATIGGLLLSFYLIRYDQDKKNRFFVSLERKTYLMNKTNSEN